MVVSAWRASGRSSQSSAAAPYGSSRRRCSARGRQSPPADRVPVRSRRDAGSRARAHGSDWCSGVLEAVGSPRNQSLTRRCEIGSQESVVRSTDAGDAAPPAGRPRAALPATAETPRRAIGTRALNVDHVHRPVLGAHDAPAQTGWTGAVVTCICRGRVRHGFGTRLGAGRGMLERMFATWMGRSISRWSGAGRRGGVRLRASPSSRRGSRSGSTQIVREADDDGDWQAAGCSSSAQWLAQLSSSDHRTAVRITRTSSALRSLPALDHALSTRRVDARSGRGRGRSSRHPRRRSSSCASRLAGRRARSGSSRARSRRPSSRTTRRCTRGAR